PAPSCLLWLLPRASPPGFLTRRRRSWDQVAWPTPVTLSLRTIPTRGSPSLLLLPSRST
ncbi:unnamed protein product, partial [Chrysoparadoxa australica]